MLFLLLLPLLLASVFYIFINFFRFLFRVLVYELHEKWFKDKQIFPS